MVEFSKLPLVEKTKEIFQKKAAPSKPPQKLCSKCQIKFDLNDEFPFAALWEDEIQDAGLMKMVPLLSMGINCILLVLVIIILAKK